MFSEVLAKSSSYKWQLYAMRRQTKNKLIIMEQTKFTRFKRIVNKELLSILIVLMLLFGSIYLLTCNSAPVEYKNIPIENVSRHHHVAKIDTFQIIDTLQIILVLLVLIVQIIQITLQEKIQIK